MPQTISAERSVMTEPAMDWQKSGGLLPAIVQDADSGRVLMLAYMNADALKATLSSGRVTFFSRSRQSLWTKGETSGHFLQLVSILPDCDNDALLIQARPNGPACHRNTPTCFDQTGQPNQAPYAFLSDLEAVIRERLKRPEPAGSYIARLNAEGVKRIAQKVGEEGVETALAGVSGSTAELLEESADLVFHLLILLQKNEISFEILLKTLQKRAK